MASEGNKLLIHTARAPESKAPAQRHRFRIKTRLSFQERLLRNCFLACAVLLGILALGNTSQPWAVKASAGIEKALTMKIDLDQSIGGLSFVEDMMPESVRVFFNIRAGSEFCLPVRGELDHAYSEAQPWLMFICETGSDVIAPADGSVSAVSRLSDGSYGLIIDHGSGRESTLACLRETNVRMGDAVRRGDSIGASGDRLYYELNEAGSSSDPSALLGL